MSVQKQVRRMTAPDIAARKGQEPIVSLTSYHAHTSAIADKYCDFLLVGDSLGMVMHGFESTVPVPLELMIMHGKAVVRGSSRALVVVDMPFGTYEESPSVAFRNAARVMKETDCGAIKLEGGARMAETIDYLVQRGIPVMAHIGLTRSRSIRLAVSRPKAVSASNGLPSRQMPRRYLKPVHFPSCLRPWQNRLQRASPARFPFPPSASARLPRATGKFWSWKTCLA
jgi:hypothetical protein